MISVEVETEKMVFSPVLGEISYQEDEVVLFPEGLIGFENRRRFIIKTKDGFEPFHWLLCLDEPSLLLPVIDPFLIMEDYRPGPSGNELQSIGIENNDDARFLAVVTVGQSVDQVSVNLRGPIVINKTRNLGKQIILMESRYLVKHPIKAGRRHD
ncbi:MAG: flagellar assembly protein FliW [Actinobacteria bacterium]|nr:flagellar assembly protein FliW [Actinomycetota bacterium]